MSILIKAFITMLKAHFRQKDKAGKPYIFHPINVMLGVKTKDAKVAALLHDVIEDSEYTLDDLYFLTDKQKLALSLLTHDKEDDYLEYIKNIKRNDIAKEVKLSDLRQNSNLNRLKNITQKDITRKEKYLKAIRILEE